MWLLAAALLVAAAPARAADPIGVITELHVANGQVDVKPAAGGDWQPAKPLLSISEGDQVRAAGAARAVLVFMGNQRSTVVTPANSPFVASPPVQPGIGERLKGAISYLQAAPREPSRKSLTVRSSRDLSPVIVLSPRDTLVAADAVSLEWEGPTTVRYAVRIVTADGRVLWESKNADAGAVTPPSGLRLAPGRYRWEVEGPGYGIHRAAFDVASPEVTAQVRAAVAAVEPARYPPATATVMRAAGLMRERFYADARRELMRAVAATPEEPTLHLLLADVYDKTGLESLAAAEQDRAEALYNPR
jgi:hypothetical protein